MQYNDIRNAFCYGCVCFVHEEIGNKYICAENGLPLRVGKHKIPQKHRDCKGPHDDMSTVVTSFDEFANLTDEQREELSNALDHGFIDKKGVNIPVRSPYGP